MAARIRREEAEAEAAAATEEENEGQDEGGAGSMWHQNIPVKETHDTQNRPKDVYLPCEGGTLEASAERFVAVGAVAITEAGGFCLSLSLAAHTCLSVCARERVCVRAVYVCVGACACVASVRVCVCVHANAGFVCVYSEVADMPSRRFRV